MDGRKKKFERSPLPPSLTSFLSCHFSRKKHLSSPPPPSLEKEEEEEVKCVFVFPVPLPLLIPGLSLPPSLLSSSSSVLTLGHGVFEMELGRRRQHQQKERCVVGCARAPAYNKHHFLAVRRSPPLPPLPAGNGRRRRRRKRGGIHLGEGGPSR